jgi:hypothetical protein
LHAFLRTRNGPFTPRPYASGHKLLKSPTARPDSYDEIARRRGTSVNLSISHWAQFLYSLDSLVAIPFCIVGLGLMTMGWRIWKICTALTFGLIGLVIGNCLGDTQQQQWLYAIGGALLLGLGSYPPANYSVALLGGIIGGGVAYLVLEKLGLYGADLWIAAGVACAGLTALSAINLRHVIILITAFEGAAAFVSGLAICVMHSPNVAQAMRSIAFASSIFLPFIVIVPTVIGVFLQMADVRQKDSGAAKA